MKETRIFFGGVDNSELLEFLDGFTDRKIVILSDKKVRENCLDKFSAICQFKTSPIVIEIGQGDSEKTIKSAEYIWSELLKNKVSHNDLFINLGGGMISDLGAFTASVYKRGMPFVNVPTTLLAMVDAAYGGKTALNFGAIKNQIGNYAIPELIFIEHDFLKTLDPIELKCGLAEMIKSSLIADKKLFVELSDLNNGQVPTLGSIKGCLKIKQSIVKQDPYEKGERKALNFGHTFAHALESIRLQSGSSMKHGEAVALGIFYESYISSKKMGFSHLELIKVRDIIYRHYSHLNFEDIDFDRLLELMIYDKKNDLGINFTLLKSIGEYKIDNYIEDQVLKDTLMFCKENFNGQLIANK
ncbi:MAG: 3-dehydroquinate synthase [Bacteroidia bacterium]|nr:3-dehydroquinate synthase [Bacteroidia bacterium]